MFEKTQTGQVTGILMKNWAAADNGCYVKTPNCEFVKIGGRVVESSPSLHRIVVNIGPAIESYPFYGKNFSGETTEKCFCPQWVVLDFLVTLKNVPTPVTLTVVQTARFENDELMVNLYLYTNKKNIRSVADCLKHEDECERLWEEICSAIGHIGFEEFFSRIIGIIPPGWGMLSKPRCGILRLSETDKHICIIPEENKRNFPDMIDMLDLGRIEKFLDNSLNELKSSFLNDKSKLTHGYINSIIERLL